MSLSNSIGLGSSDLFGAGSDDRALGSFLTCVPWSRGFTPRCNQCPTPLLFPRNLRVPMPDQVKAVPAISSHGATRLPAVDVKSYNVELKDDEGFLGDRASKGAFRAIIERWRKPLRELGHDPFGEESISSVRKSDWMGCLPRATPKRRVSFMAPSRSLRRSSRLSHVGFSSSRIGRPSALSLAAAFPEAVSGNLRSVVPR